MKIALIFDPELGASIHFWSAEKKMENRLLHDEKKKRATNQCDSHRFSTDMASVKVKRFNVKLNRFEERVAYSMIHDSYVERWKTKCKRR